MTKIDPSRGEVWQLNFNPTKGHEQSGIRPALVVSEDTFNSGPADLVIVLPISSVGKGKLSWNSILSAEAFTQRR